MILPLPPTYVTGTKCDNTYAYCCKKRPTSSPSVNDIYGDLFGVIDLFYDKCKNATIRDNVRMGEFLKPIILYISTVASI